MISALRRLLLRLVNLVWSARWEPPLDREIRTHLTMLEEEFARRGMPRDEAARAARLAFGGVAQAKERYRDARSFVWIEDASRDIRLHSARSCGHQRLRSSRS